MKPFEELLNELREHKKQARGQDVVVVMLSPEANRRICETLSLQGYFSPLDNLHFSGDSSDNVIERAKRIMELLSKETERFSRSAFRNYGIEYPTVIYEGRKMQTHATAKDIIVIDRQMIGTKARLHTIKRFATV